MQLYWWVLDYFKILPTSPEFKNLTLQQMILLSNMRKFRLDKEAEMAGNISQKGFDPEYEEWEKKELEHLKEKHNTSKEWAEI